MMTPDDIKEIREELTEIKTALVGYNGNRGLIPAFEAQCKECIAHREACLFATATAKKAHDENESKFRDEYYKFKRNVLMAVAYVAGTGVIGGGVWGLYEFITKIKGG